MVVKKLVKNGKWSLCVVIPKDILTDLDLDSESYVSIENISSEIIIKKIKFKEDLK